MPELEDMQDLFEEAAKVAGVVPEVMQQAAFNQALDMLMGTEQPQRRRETTPRRAAKRSSPSGGGDAGDPAVDRVAKVMAISRDAAPEVDRETSVQGRSIALLVAAKREADVDMLTSPEIAKILTEKFRQRTTRQAVTKAMDAAGGMIDRRRSGNDPAIYRVMKSGEDWLGTSADQRASGGRSGRRATAKRTASPPSAKETTTAKKNASPGTGRKIGPKGCWSPLSTTATSRSRGAWPT